MRFFEKYPVLAPYTDKLLLACDVVGNEAVDAAIDQWAKPERYYHGFTHLMEMLDQINISIYSYEDNLILVCAVLYHDVVYDPKATGKTNEDESIKQWINDVNMVVPVGEIQEKICRNVVEIIEATKYHSIKDNPFLSQHVRENLFICWDLASLTSEKLSVLIDAEYRIMKEYQFYDYELYRLGRIEILKTMVPTVLGINPKSKILDLIDYIEHRKISVGVYVLTSPTLNNKVLKNLEKVFDKVILLYEDDSYTLDESLSYYQTEFYPCGQVLTAVEFVRTKHIEPILIKNIQHFGEASTLLLDLWY